MKWIVLLSNILVSVLAFIFVKMSTIPQETIQAPPNLSDHLSHRLFYWIGFLCYSSSFFFYAIVVKQFPLQIAQTCVTCSIIMIITLLSSLFWKEPFYFTTGIGMIFITIGITLLSWDTI
ncbi:MAG: hypothetical protein EU981_03945 [Candidatus Liberibacter ctenarytainae]|uniref:Uncharacterized protein n=1 Tax=Candidatus Liberibacter ctenarytainae TaxID=2020335 RepID=A0A937ACH4_9HYPH|nr:hypothetical protein [Candidatus Liberibacter ctenarytainae]